MQNESESSARGGESRLVFEAGVRASVMEKVDVVVCGGGPAGVAAALAVARSQKHMGRTPSVRLIEVHGQLGGVWTTGMLSWILDAGNKGGIMQEILDASNSTREALGGDVAPRRSGRAYDVEQMKLLLEQACVEDGVQVRLHTRVVAAHCDRSKRLTHVVTESASGREAFPASCFIDCTGSGDLAALAGCQYEFGRTEDVEGGEGKASLQAQPMTLMCLVSGVDSKQIERFHRFDQGEYPSPKRALYDELVRGGLAPSYTNPTLFEIYPDLFALMMNHEYGWDPHDAQHLTDATIAARLEINQLIGTLRGLGGVWENLRLVCTAAQIGIRESRRPYGLYRVELDDLVTGRRHDDAICRCTFGIDVHATSKHRGGGSIEAKPASMLPYDIPYRALVSRDVDGLLFAGRCISGDFYAHASYRVTGNSVAMGEAAGCAAAVAVEREKLPGDIDYNQDVRPVLDGISSSYISTS